MMHEIPELDSAGLRRFGLTTGAIVGGLFGLLIPWLFGLRYPIWPWVIFAVLALWAILAPASLGPVYRGWMRFGLILNAIMSRIILGIVFYLVVFPIGLLMRLKGHDPMARQADPDADSYRVQSHATDPNKMERPF